MDAISVNVPKMADVAMKACASLLRKELDAQEELMDALIEDINELDAGISPYHGCRLNIEV